MKHLSFNFILFLFYFTTFYFLSARNLKAFLFFHVFSCWNFYVLIIIFLFSFPLLKLRCCAVTVCKYPKINITTPWQCFNSQEALSSCHWSVDIPLQICILYLAFVSPSYFYLFFCHLRCQAAIFCEWHLKKSSISFWFYFSAKYPWVALLRWISYICAIFKWNLRGIYISIIDWQQIGQCIKCYSIHMKRVHSIKAIKSVYFFVKLLRFGTEKGCAAYVRLCGRGKLYIFYAYLHKWQGRI